MKRLRLIRSAVLISSTAVVFQIAGCTAIPLHELLQTVFLGLTAAGAVAILENI